MITLMKYLGVDWKDARENLRQDLEHIQEAFNALEEVVLGGSSSQSLQSSVILGSPTPVPKYVASTGPLNNPQWDLVDLSSSGVKNRLPYGKFQAASGPALLLGTGSGGPGSKDWQEITLGAGLGISGTIISVTSSGDVTGPGSATDKAIARFNGTTGKTIQNSGITISDAAAGTLAGSNSGDVTLAGTPNYLTIAAQVITRALIDLASHVTGRLPFANLTQGSALSVLGVTGNATADEASIVAASDGQVLRRSGTAVGFGSVNLASANAVTGTLPLANVAARTGSMGIVIDGGGSVITTGIKGDLYCPVACTITAVTLLADQSGSIVVDIWKDTYANYPPTVAKTITASALPTISSALKAQDTTLTGWTVSVSAGDTIRFNVNSATSIQRLALALTITVP